VTNASNYAFWRFSTQRNLYRVSLPWLLWEARTEQARQNLLSSSNTFSFKHLLECHRISPDMSASVY
jgi:hypothetical protein